MDLNKIRDEINGIIKKRQEEIQLTFEEETHTYTMMNNQGVLVSNWISVSKVLKKFYEEFPAEEISLKKAKGDVVEQQRLLAEWKAAGDYSTNMEVGFTIFWKKNRMKFLTLLRK